MKSDAHDVVIKVWVDGRLQSTSPLEADCVFALARAGGELRYLGNATPIRNGAIDPNGPALVFNIDQVSAPIKEPKP